MAVLALMIVYPLVDTVRLSLIDGSGNFVGSENFEKVLSARATRLATYNTFFYVGF